MSTSARHPNEAQEPGHSGGTLRAWYVPGNPYDGTDTTHGTIQGTYTDAGGTVTGPFTFQWYDSGLLDLVVQDDTFGLSHASDPRAPFNLVPLIKGEGLPSVWSSFDDGQTWTRVIGTGGGTE